MKRIFIFIMFCFLGTSCDDLLEVIPENSVTFENLMRGEKEVESTVNAIRAAFRDNIAFSGNALPCMKGMIGDVFNDQDIRQAKQLSPFIHGTNHVSVNWSPYYNVVAFTNVLLDNVKYVENVPENRVKFYEGQAYFYRAYAYFCIAQIWGDAPILESGRDVAVKAKSTWEEVCQFALTDVKKAISLLPKKDSLYDYAGKKLERNDVPCRESSFALKAHICAWIASLKNDQDLFDEAIKAASEVISSPFFELANNPEEVCTSVLMGDSKEGIFEVRIDYNETSMVSQPFTSAFSYLCWPVRRDMNPEDIVTEDPSRIGAKIRYTTVDYMFDKNDLRRDAYFYKLDSMGLEVSAEVTGGFAYPYKFRREIVYSDGYDMGKFMNIDQPRIMLRLADIILLRAECYARIGNESQAIADLNKIRNRAHANPYPSISEVDRDARGVRYAIYKEREKELLWEDYRYFDMVRNGYCQEEMGTREYKELTEQDILDGALYLPIGFTAFNENPAMVQNRYWKKRLNN